MGDEPAGQLLVAAAQGDGRCRHASTALIAPLAERGITLSASQVHGLVTGTPERLNLAVLAALCDILHIGPADLKISEGADNGPGSSS